MWMGKGTDRTLINAASESDNSKVTSAAEAVTATMAHKAKVILPRYPNLCRLKQTLLHPKATAVPWPSEPTKASIKHPTGAVFVPENTASVQPSISQQQLREKKMQKPQQGPAVTVPGAGTGSSSSWCWEGWNNWSGSSWSRHWEDSGSSNSNWESHKHDSSWHWENSGDSDSTSSWHWNNIWEGNQNQKTAECAAAEASTTDVSSTASQEPSSRRSTPPRSKKKGKMPNYQQSTNQNNHLIHHRQITNQNNHLIHHHHQPVCAPVLLGGTVCYQSLHLNPKLKRWEDVEHGSRAYCMLRQQTP